MVGEEKIEEVNKCKYVGTILCKYESIEKEEEKMEEVSQFKCLRDNSV